MPLIDHFDQRRRTQKPRRLGRGHLGLTIATKINPTEPVFTVTSKTRGSSDEISE